MSIRYFCRILPEILPQQFLFCKANLKIRANDIDLRDAKRFDSFSSSFSTAKLKIAALIKSYTILKLKTSACLYDYMATKKKKIVM